MLCYILTSGGVTAEKTDKERRSTVTDYNGLASDIYPKVALTFNLKQMGRFLGLNFIDTVEIFLIETNTIPEDFLFLNYSSWIKSLKEIYGKEKSLPKHRTMGDYLIRDFNDFFNWQVERYKHLLPNNPKAGSAKPKQLKIFTDYD